jgi:hypothetical protein
MTPSHDAMRALARSTGGSAAAHPSNQRKSSKDSVFVESVRIRRTSSRVKRDPEESSSRILSYLRYRGAPLSKKRGGS